MLSHAKLHAEHMLHTKMVLNDMQGHHVAYKVGFKMACLGSSRERPFISVAQVHEGCPRRRSA